MVEAKNNDDLDDIKNQMDIFMNLMDKKENIENKINSDF